MIKPTVGRVVWFTPPGRVVWFTPPGDTAESGFVAYSDQPMAAMIAYVWSDSCVNLHVIDHNGVGHSRTSVPLIQEGEPKPQLGGFCEWMPYQIGQAKRDSSAPIASNGLYKQDAATQGSTAT